MNDGQLIRASLTQSKKAMKTMMNGHDHSTRNLRHDATADNDEWTPSAIQIQQQPTHVKSSTTSRDAAVGFRRKNKGRGLNKIKPQPQSTKPQAPYTPTDAVDEDDKDDAQLMDVPNMDTQKVVSPMISSDTKIAATIADGPIQQSSKKLKSSITSKASSTHSPQQPSATINSSFRSSFTSKNSQTHSVGSCDTSSKRSSSIKFSYKDLYGTEGDELLDDELLDEEDEGYRKKRYSTVFEEGGDDSMDYSQKDTGETHSITILSQSMTSVNTGMSSRQHSVTFPTNSNLLPSSDGGGTDSSGLGNSLVSVEDYTPLRGNSLKNQASMKSIAFGDDNDMDSLGNESAGQLMLDAAARQSQRQLDVGDDGQPQQQQQQQQEISTMDKVNSAFQQLKSIATTYIDKDGGKNTNDDAGDDDMSDSDSSSILNSPKQPLHLDLEKRSTSSSKDIINQLLDVYDDSSSSALSSRNSSSCCSSSKRRGRIRKKKKSKEKEAMGDNDNDNATNDEEGKIAEENQQQQQHQQQSWGGLINNIFPAPKTKPSYGSGAGDSTTTGDHPILLTSAATSQSATAGEKVPNLLLNPTPQSRELDNDACDDTPSTESNSFTGLPINNNSPSKEITQNDNNDQPTGEEKQQQVVVPFFKKLLNNTKQELDVGVGVGVKGEKEDDDDNVKSSSEDGEKVEQSAPSPTIIGKGEKVRTKDDLIAQRRKSDALNKSLSQRSSSTLPSFYSSASELSHFRPSLVNDFKAIHNRESFQRSMEDGKALLDKNGERNDEGVLGVDWPSPVSSLESPPTLSGALSGEDKKDNAEDDNNSTRGQSGDEEVPIVSTLLNDKNNEDDRALPAVKVPSNRVYPVQTFRENESSIRDLISSMDTLDYADHIESSAKMQDSFDMSKSVEWAPLGTSIEGTKSSGAKSSGGESSIAEFKQALDRTDAAKHTLRDLKASTSSAEAHMIHTFNKKKSKGSSSMRNSVVSADLISELSYGSMLYDNQGKATAIASTDITEENNKFDVFYNLMVNEAEEDIVPTSPSLAVDEEEKKEQVIVREVPTFKEVPTVREDEVSAFREGEKANTNFKRSDSKKSLISDLDSLASPVEFLRRQSDMMMRRESDMMMRRESNMGMIMRRVESGSSLSSMDSLASPIQNMKLVDEGGEQKMMVNGEEVKHGDDGSSSSSSSSSSSGDDNEEIISGSDGSESDHHQAPIKDVRFDASPPHPSSEHNGTLNSDEKRKAKFLPTRYSETSGTSGLNRLSYQLDDASLDKDLNNDSWTSFENSFQSSGFANDVALHLEHSTKGSEFSFCTDGIEHINPNATSGEGQEDFDFALKAYTEAVKHGHFDFHDNKAKLDETALLEGSDEVLAARAYLGLGFARQCKGELESSLNAYTTFLTLWEHEMGPKDPLIASVQFTIGTVKIEMQQQVEAADHFTKALELFKSNRPIDEGGNRASILSTEGMLFSVLGEANRAIDCFRQAVLVYQNARHSMNLKFATVMFELGSLLSQMGKYDDSANCFYFSLEIRKSLLSDSFVVARTHYSLGVTLASQELQSNTNTESASHLEEALRICQSEFDTDHVQSAVIVHALGVLNDRKGDFLAASIWFAKELATRKVIFGEGKRRFSTQHLILLLSLVSLTNSTSLLPVQLFRS